MLSLLVSGRFEFVGFPVKCAESGWHLEVTFIAFPLRAVILDVDIASLGVQNLSFGRPGASTLATRGAFWQLRDTLGTGAAGRRRGLRSQIFNDLGMIWGHHIDSFMGADALNSMFFQACF